MKTKNLLALFAMTISLASVAQAAPGGPDAMYGIEAGIRSQSGDTSTTGLTTSAGSGFQFGVTGSFPIQNKLAFRSGMLYTQRPLVLKTTATGAETKIGLNYLDIPITAMYRFEDYAGVFAGVNLALNIDKTSDGVAPTGVKSMLTPFTVGVTFKFAPQLGASLYFETGGDPADGLTSYRAVGANLLVTFD